jgi:DNA-binding MarR family transcriptional regulator
VLKQLSRRDFLRPSDIADALFCDRPTASVVIHNLAASGWVSIGVDPLNVRQRQVRISEAGRATLRAAENALAAVRKSFDPLSSLGRDEKQGLLSSLTKLEKYLGQFAQPGAAPEDETSPEWDPVLPLPADACVLPRSIALSRCDHPQPRVIPLEPGLPRERIA